MKLHLHYALFLFLLLSVAQNSISQTEFSVTVDPISGEHTILQNLPTVNFIFNNATAYDENGKRFIFRGIDFDGEYRLFCYDALTGSMISEPYIIGTSIGEFHYDNSADILYGLRILDGEMHVISIDIPTATMTNVVLLPVIGFTSGGSYFDEENQIFGFRLSGEFHKVNIATGEIVTLPSPLNLGGFQYDDTNNKLYGLKVAIGSTELVEIDVTTGIPTTITTMPESGYVSITTSFDEINQYFTYSSPSFLYTVDVQTGEIIWDPIFPLVLPGQNVIELHYDNESGTLYGLHWGSLEDVVTDTLTATVANDTICQGEMATLTVVGPGDFDWTLATDPTTVIETENTLTISPTETTHYFALNDEDTIGVTVVVIETVADFTVTDTSGCDPVEVQYTNSSTTTPGSISGFLWTFWDGTTSLIEDPTYIYTESGLYETTLQVFTDFGCSSTLTIETNISVTAMPIALFSFSPESPEEDEEVAFTDESTDPEFWSWDFGDGSYATIQHPTHTFTESGIYDVTLTVSNGGCQDSYTLQVIVEEEVIDDTTITDDPIFDDTIITDDIIVIDTTKEDIGAITEEELIFYIPNAFASNLGGTNTTFTPIFTSGYDPYNYHLTIFNRWGEIVFESYDSNIGWDGTYGQRGLVRSGVYIWQIEFRPENSDSNEIYRGHLSLID